MRQKLRDTERRSLSYKMIKSNDLVLEFRSIHTEIMSAIENVLHKGNYILGQQVEEFEKEFSDYINVKHTIGVNSGTDALFIALTALGIGPGDEVITVAHTFISTVDSITRNGASPILVDIDKDTFCIDPEKVKSRITQKTKAIIPVHLYGHPADMEPILDLAQKHGLYVIEDASQAHGGLYKKQKIGGIGHLGCFSFYPIKNLGAYGDAGAIVTNDDSLEKKIRMLRNYGRSGRYIHEFVGINSRLDELQATVLRVKLRHLDAWIEKRRNISKEYSNELKGLPIALPVEKDYAKHAYHLYVIRSKEREKLLKGMEKLNIPVAVHYPVPVHKQNAYSQKLSGISLPETEEACSQILSLPMHPFLKSDEIKTIAQTIRDCLNF